MAMFHRNKAEFLQRFITMDATWVCTVVRGAVKAVVCKGRIVCTVGEDSSICWQGYVFWDARGIIFIDYLQKRKTINGEYYAYLLQHLSGEIKGKRQHLPKQKVLLHQKNVSIPTFTFPFVKINDLKLELLQHALYSTDLGTSDYFLFPILKKWLGSRIFANNEEVRSYIYVYELDSSYYKQGAEAIEHRWKSV